jgi:nucleoside 2-deoxyribosyltransferase
MRVYVASSWRNPIQPPVITRLRNEGHEVYDFRNPKENDHGFHWSELDLRWKEWKPQEFIDALEGSIAKDGYKSDIDALNWANAVVLVLSSGRSAHLELGYAAGKGVLTIIYLADDVAYEPELMYKMADYLTTDLNEVVNILGQADSSSANHETTMYQEMWAGRK